VLGISCSLPARVRQCRNAPGLYIKEHIGR
jgi:hypothetical protein